MKIYLHALHVILPKKEVSIGDKTQKAPTIKITAVVIETNNIAAIVQSVFDKDEEIDVLISEWCLKHDKTMVNIVLDCGVKINNLVVTEEEFNTLST